MADATSCPSKKLAAWGKFLASLVLIAAPQVPVVGPILVANPELSISLAGAVMALFTGEAPAAATKRVAAKVKARANGALPK